MYVYTMSMIQRSWFLRCRALTREILHTRATSESLSYLERSLLLFALGLRDAHVAHALLLRGARHLPVEAQVPGPRQKLRRDDLMAVLEAVPSGQ